MLRGGYHNMDRGSAAALAIIEVDADDDTDNDLDFLDTLGSVLLLKRDSALFREGDPATSYYKVVSGAVRAYKLLPDGRRHITDFFMAGDLIGIGTLLTHACTVESVNDATLIRYERRAIDAMIMRSPRLGRLLLGRVCAELSKARTSMLLLGRMSARERLASFLLRIAARNRRDGSDIIPLPMTRADIGDHLGLTTETVCRTFAQLKSAGIIAAESPHELRVLEHQALAALAQGV